MAAAIKMDELLVSWLGSDTVYESVLKLVQDYKETSASSSRDTPPGSPSTRRKKKDGSDEGGSGDATIGTNNNSNDNNNDNASSSQHSPRGIIPPLYPSKRRQLRALSWLSSSDKSELEQHPHDTNVSEANTADSTDPATSSNNTNGAASNNSSPFPNTKAFVESLFEEYGHDPPLVSPTNSSTVGGVSPQKYVLVEHFTRITKEVCHFPTFFNGALYKRILLLWNTRSNGDGGDDGDDSTTTKPMEVVTLEMMEWFFCTEMEPHDAPERFFRLLKQPQKEYIGRDDFLPVIKELLSDHPGLEFLSNHAEFQEKYAVTVITRIFYNVNKCHSGRITSRQIRRSDLLDAFQQADEEEDINKVTRYFSYEHFYVLYCRFWELDHDRDYCITRSDLLKYGDHSLSHMIVDRIFDAAPRPFHDNNSNNKNNNNNSSNNSSSGGSKGEGDKKSSSSIREYLSYEDFIFFMLSEEDKANEVSVRYWFSCLDVDGDGRLNNMEMRSFYAVQLHRMQCMGHEIVPFEDMLCQMMDMIKPKNPDYLVVEDFLQPECAQVSGSLFDALFNLNKYLMFEQRDPFVERQKREDEFETDWDRFAFLDYNRLAMEEEAREEEAMEIDWVTVDDEDDDGSVEDEFSSLGLGSASEAPF